MSRSSEDEPGRSPRRLAASSWVHVAGLIALSSAYESLFLHHGMNPVDEGWPLYAAMQLHDGGVLYRDVFFPLPPGHLLGAWLAYALDPPGVTLARHFYAGFNVSLVVVLYFLGRRIMPPAVALLGCAMLAVAAPSSHISHLLFGYRYLLFGALSLWCFSERLHSGDRRWMIAAGALAGVALLFRLTPALAVIGGLGVGIAVANRSWRSWWADASRLAIGFTAVVVPVLAWFAASVGLETIWREIVVRPIVMTELQSLPVPPLELPWKWGRWPIRNWFIALQFRLYAALYLTYAAVLGAQVVRSLLARRRFESPLLLAVVVCGGIFFLRAFGRADGPHLDSTIPLTCLLVAHAVGLPLRRALERPGLAGRAAQLGLVAVFGAWVFLSGSDLYLRPELRGMQPVTTLGSQTAIAPRHPFEEFDEVVNEIRMRTSPEDVVMDLSALSLLYVASERRGPGAADVLMPGTFLDAAEERAFLERLERSPPALVIALRKPADKTRLPAISHWAPGLLAWVRDRYDFHRGTKDFIMLLPKRSQELSGDW